MEFKGKSTMTWKEFCSAMDRYLEEVAESIRVKKEVRNEEERLGLVNQGVRSESKSS